MILYNTIYNILFISKVFYPFFLFACIICILNHAHSCILVTHFREWVMLRQSTGNIPILNHYKITIHPFLVNRRLKWILSGLHQTTHKMTRQLSQKCEKSALFECCILDHLLLCYKIEKCIKRFP